MRSRILVPVLVYLAMTTSVVSSLGAPLVPTIARETHVSLATAQWSLTISLLVGAVATPTLGRLGDGRHRRTAALFALVAVVLGCVLAGLPGPFAQLLVGRGLMGIGLGLVPLTMAVARDTTDEVRRPRVVGLLSVSAVAGIGLGYPLTGLVAEHLGFRAAFWLGGGVAALALVLAALVVPSTSHRPATRLDVVGALLLAAGSAGLLLALGQAETWDTGLVLGLAALSLLVGAAWIAWELRVDEPLVQLRLLRDRTVLTANLTGLLAGVGMFMLMSVIIRFAQTPSSTGYGLGASIVVSGLLLVPLSVLSTASSRIAPALGRRFGQRAVLPIGCAVFVVANLVFAFERSHLWELTVVTAIAGLGIGCTFAALPGLIIAHVPADQTGSAMSVNLVIRYIGYSTGSALSATVLEAHTAAGQVLPGNGGYTVVALTAVAVLTVAGVVSAVVPGRETPPPDDLVEESLTEAIAD